MLTLAHFNVIILLESEVNYLKERLKELRKKLGITQQEFADRIGIKRNSYANYETGRNTPIDAIVKSICREFNVNESWLRTGEGNLFLPEDREAEILRLANKLLTEPDGTFKSTIISAILETNSEDWEALERFIDRILEKERKKRSE